MTTSSSNDLAMITYAKGELSPEELKQFMMLYPTRKKSVSTGVLFALLLGGLGAHKFWLGQNGLGVLYLLCGTIGWVIVVPPLIIGIICLIEACTMGDTVRTANMDEGRALIQEIQLLRN
jgi:TM2 domain-containing membrane protein YozV